MEGRRRLNRLEEAQQMLGSCHQFAPAIPWPLSPCLTPPHGAFPIPEPDHGGPEFPTGKTCTCPWAVPL